MKKEILSRPWPRLFSYGTEIVLWFFAVSILPWWRLTIFLIVLDSLVLNDFPQRFLKRSQRRFLWRIQQWLWIASAIHLGGRKFFFSGKSVLRVRPIFFLLFPLYICKSKSVLRLYPIIFLLNSVLYYRKSKSVLRLKPMISVPNSVIHLQANTNLYFGSNPSFLSPTE